MGITETDMTGSKYAVKEKIRIKTNTYFQQKIDNEGKDKSKVKHLINGKKNIWTSGKIPNYMNKLTRNQVSTIFKARTRMLDIKNNFKNKYQNNNNVSKLS